MSKGGPARPNRVGWPRGRAERDRAAESTRAVLEAVAALADLPRQLAEATRQLQQARERASKLEAELKPASGSSGSAFPSRRSSSPPEGGPPGPPGRRSGFGEPPAGG